MIQAHRFELRKGSKKERCPGCGQLSFKPYHDTHLRLDLIDGSGRCDREQKCGWNKPPNKAAEVEPWNIPIRQAPEIHKPIFIPDEVLKRLEANRQDAGFLQNLISSVDHPWPIDDVWMRAAKYRCGAIPLKDPDKAISGAIAFPFIDIAGRCHSIQIKSFDSTNHTTAQTWVHTILKKKQYKATWLDDYETQKDLAPLTRCLFGEHLINSGDPGAVIGIVEAPKTAIICDHYFADQGMIWLAAGAKSWLKPERCQALKGRKVIFFPDASEDGGTYTEWLNKATAISQAIGCNISVNNMLEKMGDEVIRKNGADLADILLAHPWQYYRTSSTTIEKMISKNAHVSTLIDVLKLEPI
jgi:hypothetical protein